MKKYLILSILALATAAYADVPTTDGNPASSVGQPTEVPPADGTQNGDQTDDGTDGQNEDEDVIIMEEDESENDGNNN